MEKLDSTGLPESIQYWNLEYEMSGLAARYARMRYHYLKEFQEEVCRQMFQEGTLGEHLRETGEQAEELQERLVRQMAEQDPPPDKASDSLGWTAHMNGLIAQAREIVLHDRIYC